MDKSKEEMVQKILKLLALGNDENNYTPERETAQRKAAQLMAEHSLEFADLKGKTPKGMFTKINIAGTAGEQIDWEFSLSGNVASTFDCKVVGSTDFGSSQGDWKNTFNMVFMGTKGDLELAVFFFTYLRRTVGRMAEVRYKGKRDQATYAFGCVSTLKERMEDLFKKREEFIPSSGKELIVIKKEKLAKFVLQEFPHRKRTTFNVGKNHSAYNQGKNDGKRINLQRPISHNGNASNGG